MSSFKYLPLLALAISAVAGCSGFASKSTSNKSEQNIATGRLTLSLPENGPATPGAVCPKVLHETVPQLDKPELKLVQQGFKGAEGVVWVHAERKLYFSAIERNRKAKDISWQDGRSASIIKLDPFSGESEVWVEASGTNGLALSPDGKTLYGAAHDRREIAAFDLSSGERRSVANKLVTNKPFNSPNDLTFRSDGHVYFSDPSWHLEGIDGGNPVPGTMPAIWVKPNGEAQVFDTELIQPNGITLSPDEKTLYVTHIDGNPANDGKWGQPGKVFAYTVNADGSVTNKRLFAKTTYGGDGMVVDCAGNLYVTLLGKVDVFSPAGKFLGTIETKGPTYQASNIAFGGVDNKTLYITVEQRDGLAENRVYSVHSVEMNIPGLPY